MNVSGTSATGLPRAVLLFAALLYGSCTGAFGQAASNDYTNGLPSVERVKTQIQGTDPADTVARLWTATGPYYFFAIVPNGSGSTVWDVPANLAAGDNTVSFTAANAEKIP